MTDQDIPLTPVFNDAAGNEWDLTLSVGVIEDIQDKSTVNLNAMLKKPEELATLLIEDPQKLGQLLWVICEDQAKKRNIGPREFGRLLKREIIDVAVNSLIAAIVLFYPRGSAGRILAEQLPAIIRKMDGLISERARVNAERILLDTPTA